MPRNQRDGRRIFACHSRQARGPDYAARKPRILARSSGDRPRPHRRAPQDASSKRPTWSEYLPAKETACEVGTHKAPCKPCDRAANVRFFLVLHVLDLRSFAEGFAACVVRRSRIAEWTFHSRDTCEP